MYSERKMCLGINGHTLLLVLVISIFLCKIRNCERPNYQPGIPKLTFEISDRGIMFRGPVTTDFYDQWVKPLCSVTIICILDLDARCGYLVGGWAKYPVPMVSFVLELWAPNILTAVIETLAIRGS